MSELDERAQQRDTLARNGPTPEGAPEPTHPRTRGTDTGQQATE